MPKFPQSEESLVTVWYTKEEWEAALARGRANPLRLKSLPSQGPIGDGIALQCIEAFK